eukprot:359650-Chlamydomonas_euryale.AAC.1
MGSIAVHLGTSPHFAHDLSEHLPATPFTRHHTSPAPADCPDSMSLTRHHTSPAPAGTPTSLTPWASRQHADGPDPMSLPPHGTEVFVSKIPREATDAQLLSFCESTGHKLHSVRLTKDPGNPGQNKGYAFAVYTDRDGATDALTKLNQTELPDFPGKKLTLARSEVKNKLFVGNIPRTMAREDVLEKINSE